VPATPEAIAVCLLFSFRDAGHERSVVAELRRRYPEAHVVASHEVAPEFREYERASTTVIDAYLGYLKFTEGQPLSNRPLFLGGILLIVVGVQFISIGLLGEMIIKTSGENPENYSIRETLK